MPVYLHMEPDPLNIIVIFIAIIFVLVYGYATAQSAADAVVGFFSQPRPFVVYLLVTIAPLWFIRTFPGSLVTFVAGMTLFLALRGGLQ